MITSRIFRLVNSKIAFFISGILITLVFVAGIAYAASENTIYACVNRIGRLRIVASIDECVFSESPLEWNKEGPQGPVGPPGPEGPPGPAGEDPRFGTNTSYGQEGRGTECTMGEIILTAGTVANGLPAQGQLLPISQYTALFSLLGTLYGGDGHTTFGLPDLRGVAPNGLTYSICIVGIYPTRR